LNNCISSLKDGSAGDQKPRGESNPAHFVPERRMPAAWKNTSRNTVTARKRQPGRLRGRAFVLFRYNPPAKLMQKIHRLTDN
jgi:hypothetical protein